MSTFCYFIITCDTIWLRLSPLFTANVYSILYHDIDLGHEYHKKIMIFHHCKVYTRYSFLSNDWIYLHRLERSCFFTRRSCVTQLWRALPLAAPTRCPRTNFFLSDAAKKLCDTPAARVVAANEAPTWSFRPPVFFFVFVFFLIRRHLPRDAPAARVGVANAAPTQLPLTCVYFCFFCFLCFFTRRGFAAWRHMARSLRHTDSTSTHPCFFLFWGFLLRFVAYCARQRKLHSRKREISCPVGFHKTTRYSYSCMFLCLV